MDKAVEFKEFCTNPKNPRPKVVLALIYYPDNKPKRINEIRKLCFDWGVFTKNTQWNLSVYLSRLKGHARQTSNGWEVTRIGADALRKFLTLDSVVQQVNLTSTKLKTYISKIMALDTRNFLTEAILCFDNHFYKAAVVFSWVGAVSVLQDEIIKKHLNDFNAEAQRRSPKWKMAKTKDDLSAMKEFDFLEVLNAISVIGKNVKEELQICLKLRNGCGHPSSLEVAESRVSSHIEILVLNVFSKFC